MIVFFCKTIASLFPDSSSNSAMNPEETTPGASAITPVQNPRDLPLSLPPSIYTAAGSYAMGGGDSLGVSYLAQLVPQMDEVVKSIKAQEERNAAQESLNRNLLEELNTIRKSTQSTT